jgi:uncharacterized FlaG/YvyC family protein
MSINPVNNVSPAAVPPVAEASSVQRQTWTVPGVRTVTANADAGAAPKPEITAPQPSSATSELPEDKVQVLRDSATNNDVVVKYLDHSGNVIVQVPSSELLGLARSISEDFARSARERTTTTEAVQEGKGSHGH